MLTSVCSILGHLLELIDHGSLTLYSQSRWQLMMNFSDVPKGWKVYVLTWTWLGIAVLASGSAFSVAFIIWAVGASAGWLLAPTIRTKGWLVAVRYLAASAVMLVALLMGVLAFGATRNREIALGTAIALGFAAALLWKPRVVFGFIAALMTIFDVPSNGPSETTAPHERPEKNWCPQCGRFELFRRSDGRLGCYCGYKSSASGVRGNDKKAPSEQHDDAQPEEISIPGSSESRPIRPDNPKRQPLPAASRKAWREWSKRYAQRTRRDSTENFKR